MTLKEILLNRSSRLYACEKSLYLFSMYYFRHYWTHSSPDFHRELCINIDDLINGDYKYLIACGFRGSAKTSLAKIALLHQIVFNKRRMCLFVSYDEDSSKDNLFDVALELQTNIYLLDDFGQLYFDTGGIKRSQKTGVGNFLTSNGIRVMASSVKKAVRGKTFAGGRPDFVIIDDFENNKTKVSSADTKRVISYFDELVGGLSPGCAVIYCCNKISDTGSVARLYDRAELNSEWRIWEKAVIENGVITWDRYVSTDQEALDLNKNIKIKSSWYISLEGLKRTYNSKRPGMFEQEMLNIPLVEGNRVFNIDIIDKDISLLDNTGEKDGFWTVWREYITEHEYRIGVDVSEGYGIDSSVIQVIDVTVGEQVAEYVNNLATPSELCSEIIDAHHNYGNCIALHERNSVGSAVTEILKERGYSHIMPLERKMDAVKRVVVEKYGWHTNSSSKPKMIFNLKKTYENGEIKIYSKALLQEMRAFNPYDMRHKSFDPTDFITKHFDRVMAFCIANEAKIYDGTNYGRVTEQPNQLPFKTNEAYDGFVVSQ